VDFSAFASVSADGMASADSCLAAFFERSKPAAAAAGRAIMAFVLELDVQIAWKLNKTPIEFHAWQYSCALRPVKHRNTFWTLNNSNLEGRTARLLGKGRASYIRLKSPGDVDETPMNLVGQAHRTEDLRPLYCLRPLM
jgi:hypothetical protein